MNFEKIIILSCIYQSAEMGSSLLFIYRRINYNKKCTSDWYITSYILFRNISVSYILLYDTILSLFCSTVNDNFPTPFPPTFRHCFRQTVLIFINFIIILVICLNFSLVLEICTNEFTPLDKLIFLNFFEIFLIYFSC